MGDGQLMVRSIRYASMSKTKINNKIFTLFFDNIVYNFYIYERAKS